MASVAQEVENTMQKLADMTKDQINSITSDWIFKIEQWMAMAKEYVISTDSLVEKLSKRSRTILGNLEQIAINNYNTQKEMIEGKRLLQEGYVLLNQIGEQIRGEEVTYSVTITAEGEALSSAAKVYTITTNLEEFLNMQNATSRRLIMKDPTTLYNQYINTNNKNSKIKIEEWTPEKIQNFQIFNSQIRKIQSGKKVRWKHINEGQALEAFLRAEVAGISIIAEPKGNRAYWGSLAHIMKTTMGKPDPFYQGGDIGNEQIKGLHASITNINTLIATLNRTLFAIRRGQQGIDTTIKNKMQNEVTAGAENTAKTIEEQVIKNLQDIFVSKTIRINVVNA